MLIEPLSGCAGFKKPAYADKVGHKDGIYFKEANVLEQATWISHQKSIIGK